MNEKWKPVVGYEGLYEVSDRGNVRSLDRLIPCRDGRVMRRRGQLIKVLRNDVNTMSVGLNRDNVSCRRAVCQLVLEAFVGPRPQGHECLHGAKGILDNSLDNLCWAPNRTSVRGENNHHTSLTVDSVQSIRARLSYGETVISVARDFRVKPQTIRNIKVGRRWAHIA